MSKYAVNIDVGALQDIQEITDWYNEQSPGLGSRFQKQVVLQISKLENYPDSYGVRYANVRCMVVKKFPFLIHFVANNLTLSVEVYAVIHTSRHPKIWEEKRNR
jgi:hypothetical protein